MATCDVEDWLWFPGWFRDVLDSRQKGGGWQRSKDHKGSEDEDEANPYRNCCVTPG